MRLEEINLYQQTFPLSGNELVDSISESVMHIIRLFQDYDESLINLEKFTLFKYTSQEFPTTVLLEDTLYDIYSIIDVLIKIEIGIIQKDKSLMVTYGKDIKVQLDKDEVNILVKLKFILQDKLEVIKSNRQECFKIMFASRLKHIAKLRNIKGKELAKLLNVSKQTVSEWFNAKTLPSHHIISEIAVHLNIDVDYLFKAEIDEVTLLEDAVKQHLGIYPDNLKKVQKLKESYPTKYSEITRTLNIMIENLMSDNSYDILTAISKYLDNTNSQVYHLVTSKDIDDSLWDLFDDYEARHQLGEKISDFKNALTEKHIEYHGIQYDSSFIELETIKTILQRIKSKTVEEFPEDNN